MRSSVGGRRLSLLTIFSSGRQRDNVFGKTESHKAENIFLRFARRYSMNHLHKRDLTLTSYTFKPSDFTTGRLSPLLEKDTAPSIKFCQECLQSEIIKVFVEHIFVDGQLLMVVKTWQKVKVRSD